MLHGGIRRATTATAGTTAMAVDGATGTATTAAAAAAVVMATATTGDLMDVETGPVATDLHYGDGTDGRTAATTTGGVTAGSRGATRYQAADGLQQREAGQAGAAGVRTTRRRRRDPNRKKGARPGRREERMNR